jgi:hypothetical protein
MKLSVVERVLLGAMMATYKGTFVNIKLVREGREALSFNEEENAALNFVQAGEQLTWDPDAAVKYISVDIILGKNVTKIIKEILQKLNDDASLTEQDFSIYEKFVESNLEVVK